MERRKRVVLTSVLLLVVLPAWAQFDLDISARRDLSEKVFVDSGLERPRIEFGFSNGQRVLNLTLGPWLYTYQRYLSPQISASCLYHPTCSEYSRHLFHALNPLKAFFSTVDRLMRCDRLAATDIRIIQIDRISGKKGETVNYYKFSDK